MLVLYFKDDRKGVGRWTIMIFTRYHNFQTVEDPIVHCSSHSTASYLLHRLA